jgi:hypothetical protein
MRALLGLVKKDLALFRADRRAMLLTLLAPALFATFFGLAFHKGKGDLHLEGRLVAEDDSAAGQRLAQALGRMPTMTLPAASRAEAADLVARGTIHLAIVIPAGFTAAVAAAGTGSGPPPALPVLADPSSPTEARVAEGIVSQLLPHVLAGEMGPSASDCAARGVGILAILLATALSGAWLPAFLFPPWLQKATLVVPTRWAIDGLDAMTWRGLDLSAALAPAAILFASAAVMIVLALWRFRWEE